MKAGRFLRLSLSFAAAFLVVACSDNPSGSPPTDTPPAAAEHSVETVATASITLLDTWADALDHTTRLATGDLDGDGRDDLVVGVPGADGPKGDRQDAGAVFIVSGEDLHGDGELSDLATATIFGAVSGDNLGVSVTVGDLNDDGTEDLAAGATGSNGIPEVRTDMGEVFALFGGPGLEGAFDLADRQFDVLFQPAEGFSQMGTSLAVGDISGDGIDDLAMGAPYAGRVPGTPAGGPRTTIGEVYAFYGSAELSGVLKVADGDESLLLSGTSEFDQFGRSVAVEDIDEDGLSEVFVGAPGFDPSAGPPDAGAALVFGDFAASTRQTAENAVALIGGSADGGQFGDSVGWFRDTGLLVGAPAEGEEERPGCGILHGETSMFVGSSSGEYFPSSVLTTQTAGRTELVIGSPRAGGGAGAVFFINPAAAGTVDLASPPTDSRVISGIEGGGLGSAMATGDYDGDDHAEIAVLASPATATGTAVPTVYIIDA